MKRGVFDSDVVIDYLQNEQPASDVIAQCDERLISRVTWIEVLVRAPDAAEEARIRSLLQRFTIVEVTSAIAQRALELRRNPTPKLKLPDAIIYATAQVEGCPLLTRNTRDFSSTTGDVIVPYIV
ncbi:MAG: PIN domain-containing protein [Chthoniobacterales bacterium]